MHREVLCTYRFNFKQRSRIILAALAFTKQDIIILQTFFTKHLFNALALCIVFLFLSSCATQTETKVITSNKENTQIDQMEQSFINGTLTMPVDPSIVKGSLDNGLTYIIRPNVEPKDYIELRLVVKAGSIYEDESQLGFAHFAEHMAFNGTEDFKEQEIVEFVESIGMRFGAHLNASTGFDTTTYKLSVPTNNESNIETAIHILENWAHKVTFGKQAVEDERGVVLEEWRGRKGVSERVAKQQWPIVFAGTNYAQRLPIGTEENIQTGKIADLKRFYDTWYQPENMAVIAVGDVNPAVIENYIKQYFSSIESKKIDHNDKNQSNKRSNEGIELDNHDSLAHPNLQFLEEFTAPVIKTIIDPELTGINLQVTWRNNVMSKAVALNGLPEYTLETYQQEIVKNLAIGILRKRFSDLTLDTSSAFAGANVNINRIIPTAEGFSLNASIKPKRVFEAYRDLLIEVKRAVLHGVTRQEFQKEKQLYLEWFESALASQNTLNHNVYVNTYINHVVANSPLTSLEQDYQLTQLALKDIGISDLHEQIQTWAEHQNATVFFTAPDNMQQQIPQEPMLDDIWQQVQLSTPDPLPESEVIDSLLSAPIEAGNVITKNWLDKFDAHEWILSNGIKVILKQTDFKDNEIIFNAISNGGYAMVNDEEYIASFGMMNTMNFLGLGNLNMQEFNQFAREKRFSANISVSEYGESVSGSSNQEDLIYLMQALHLRFTSPVKDQERFDWLKANYKPRLENKYNNPNARFYAALQEKTNAGNPRNKEFDVALLEKQSLEKIYKVYKERFANPADFVFVFVGDLDLPKMESLVNQYVASLPTTDIKEVPKKLPHYKLEGSYEVHMETGTEPKATVIYSVFNNAKWTFKNQVMAGALRQILEKQLRERLREELGGVYSVSVRSRLTRWPYEDFSLSISFTCDPERIEQLTSEVKTAITNAKNGDIDPISLSNFKTQAITAREKSLRSNPFWLRHIGNHFTPSVPLPMHEHDDLINSISMEDLAAFTQQYLETDTFIYATLKPES